jgi:hypothetical protein
MASLCKYYWPGIAHQFIAVFVQFEVWALEGYSAFQSRDRRKTLPGKSIFHLHHPFCIT